MSAGQVNASIWLQGLIDALGTECVLTSPEDIYVYSHHGEFATRRSPPPIAVIRLSSDEDEKTLAELMKPHDIPVVRLKGRDEPPDPPYLLMDDREPLDTEELAKSLSELMEAREQGKRGLRDASSLSQRFISSIKLLDGQRLGSLEYPEEGFCVVHLSHGGSEIYSAKGRLLLCRGLLNGELQPTQRLVDSIYRCTACGQCYDQISLEGLEMNNAITKARQEITRKGMGPKECAAILENLREHGNPMGMPAEDRPLWYEDLAEDNPLREGSALYWTGCTTSYRLPEVVEATAHVLRQAGLDFGVMGGEEGCCGLILYLLGLWENARENAEKVLSDLTARGVKRMTTSCAGCYYAFTRVYRALGVHHDIVVEHTSQTFEQLIREGRLHPGPLKETHVWHDPCDLGRHCGVYRSPRYTLSKIPGLQLQEPLLTREHATCCGGGGGLPLLYEDTSQEIALQKLNELTSPMPHAVVTACPSCIISLRHAARIQNTKTPIQDISQILKRATSEG